MLRIATKEYFEGLTDFRRHLPPGKDDELLVLKGHLLVERLLERFHSQHVARPEHLVRARLTFAQKLAVAASLRAEPEDDWLWDAIGSFNTLRNELVHQLPAPKFAELKLAFLRRVESSEEFPDLEPPSDIHERLHRGIFSLHEAMSHRVTL